MIAFRQVDGRYPFGWIAADHGRPPVDLLDRVRHFRK
jgi:hypothetical protein